MSSEKVHVEHCKGVNGLDKVYLYGGQVTSWKNAHGEELLFVSSKASFRPPRAIRGGIPICFPQLKSTGSLEQYGFARNRIWSIDPDPPSSPSDISHKAFVDLILTHSEEDMKIWPHRYEYRLRVALGPTAVELLWFKMMHTVFLGIESSVDKVYLSTPTKIAILDHERKRTFELRKYGLPDAVVWNPWDKKAKAMADFGDNEYMHMLCVEAACVEEPITLKPGEEWKGRQEISAVPSSYYSEQLDPRRLLLSG
ncbi:hypothetical protein GOBAR_AA12626 [Gossypium barbadense]|uniref:glucose-6-phosphate 1-epimerase n=1 Tax=Gossypium barbadense TaxID=3634 RepID=A0A2P5XXD7_GOSBA|nr:hypothetical protein GOBAR_AA12626 [Gossypium barbadense]